MNSRNSRGLALALGLAAALAVPALAAGHGSVYTDTAKVLPASPAPIPPDQAGLVDQTRYVYTQHGYTAVFRETNGITTGGVVSYTVLPGSYRRQAGFTPARMIAEGQTGVQPHATCQGAPALGIAQVLAWQDDPFYGYIPWQAGAAGFDDDPARWLPVVQSATGVDLRTVADPAAACAGVGGTYAPADTIQTTTAALAEGTVGEATGPLQATITSAEMAAAGLRGTVDRLTADLAAARTALDAAKPLTVSGPAAPLTVAAMRSAGVPVTVTGQPGAALRVQVLLPPERSRAAALRSRVVVGATVTVGADGTATATLRPGAARARALARVSGPVRVVVRAVHSASSAAG